MAVIVKPPQLCPEEAKGFISMFLAGSIEMGTAEDWQAKVQNIFEKTDIVLYNPRRDNWDSSWEQSIDNPNFKEQVTWELDHIEKSDYVVIYLDPKTKSPISLLELGVLTKTPNKVLVCCPKGFWRKGNVEVVCDRYGIGLIEDEKYFYIALERLAGDIEIRKQMDAQQ